MMTRVLGISMVLLLFIAGPVPAQVVSPLQSGHYSPALLNVRDMAQPPPGLFVLWYNAFVNSDKYIDRNGDEFTGLRLSDIDPRLPNVSVNVDLGAYAAVPALYWASPFEILGGARYMAGVVPSFVSADVSILTAISGGIIDTTITIPEKATVSGFSDLYVSPVGLSWGFEKFDVSAFYGFYAPTGRYAKGASDNTGLGFWTHQFQGFGYFYPSPDKATAVMLGLTFELNGKVEDSDVRPGSRFTLEWGVSQYLSDRFEIGVQGGHNWQLSDDSGDGVFWDPSYHDRKSTMAFALGYWALPEWAYVSGRYAFDYGVRQRFKNSTWSINLIIMTHLLAGAS